jgi:Mrp family chromosome partitioning ATPase
MELREYLAILRRRAVTLLIPLIVALLGVTALALLSPRTYTSTTTLYLRPGNAEVSGSLVPQQMASYAELVKSYSVASAIVAKLKLDEDIPAVQNMLAATSDQTSLLLGITATASAPDVAQDVARAAAVEVINLSDQLDPQPTGTTQGGQTAQPETGLKVVVAATPPRSTTVSTLGRNLALAIVLGLVVGVAAALVRDGLDSRIIEVSQLREDRRLRTVGSAPVDPEAWGDAFRSLRTALLPNERGAATSVIVAGCRNGRGTMAVVCGLGITMARLGLRVVVVGADTSHSGFSQQVRLGARPGLAEVLRDGVAVEDALQPWGGGERPLQVLPPGDLPATPGELLSSEDMVKVIARLRSSFDLVLVAAPPLLPYPDAATMAVGSDSGVLLAVRYAVTHRDELTEALDVVEDSGARLLGAVLTMVPDHVWRRGRHGRRRRGESRRGRSKVSLVEADAGRETPTVEPTAAADSADAQPLVPRMMGRPPAEAQVWHPSGGPP